MSRAYDAKQAAIAAYPEDKESGVVLFLGFLGCSENDFEYENNQTPEQYIYGDK